MDARSGSGLGQRIYADIVPPHELTQGQGDSADTLIIDVTGMIFLFCDNKMWYEIL